MKNKIKYLCLFLAVFMLAVPFVSMAASVVIDGKDGWYFYSGDSTIQDYNGTNLMTVNQLEALKQRLMLTRDLLEEQGREFYVYLAPNKEYIYSDYMPDSYGPPAPYTCMEEVYDYLKGDLNVICPIAELKEAKQAWPQYDLYFRTGTHWTDAGTYIATNPLLEDFGIIRPPLGDLEVLTVPNSGFELGELSNRTLPDKVLFLYGYTDRTASLQTDSKTYVRYHTEGADPRKVLIYGDSFGMSLADGLSTEFDDVYCFYRTERATDLLTTEQPDIVIYEVLERFLDLLPLYPLLP